jgi:hypothetical protein
MIAQVPGRGLSGRVGRSGVDAAELLGQRESALGLNVFGEEAAGSCFEVGKDVVDGRSSERLTSPLTVRGDLRQRCSTQR